MENLLEMLTDVVITGIFLKAFDGIEDGFNYFDNYYEWYNDAMLSNVDLLEKVIYRYCQSEQARTKVMILLSYRNHI
jgi:hypothetical protein